MENTLSLAEIKKVFENEVARLENEKYMAEQTLRQIEKEYKSALGNLDMCNWALKLESEKKAG